MGLKNQSKRQPPMKQGSSNDFQTPPEAIWPLLPYIKKDWIVWEPACGEGNIVAELERNGITTIGTDILGEYDFLEYKEECFDCIITNPPYSLKQEFLQRCYALGKPFALLLPLTTFETKKRQDLFKHYGVQVLFFDKRINFKTPSGAGGGAWFSTAWFTWGLDMPNVLNYTTLSNGTQKVLEGGV